MTVHSRAHNTDTVHLVSVVDAAGATVVVSCSENGSVLMWDGDLLDDRVGTIKRPKRSPRPAH